VTSILGSTPGNMNRRRGAKDQHLQTSKPALPAYSDGVKSKPLHRPAAALAPNRGWLGDAGLAICFVLLLAFLTPISAQTPTLNAVQISAPTNSAPLPPAVLVQALNLARQVATVLAPAQARVVAEAGHLDPRLTLAPCAQIQAHLLAGVPAWGRTRVGLRCSDGVVRWNVSLPVTVQVWAPAVVLLADLPAGARLAAQHLGQAEVDWASATGAPFDQSAALQGRSLLRPLTAGQALRASDLQTRQWFARGDTVQVVAVGAGFAISADGEALGPGLEGQAVRVRLGGSQNANDPGRTVAGRPVGDRRVEVKL
jgi:flagellar basal body P-ring formation protein FlgA